MRSLRNIFLLSPYLRRVRTLWIPLLLHEGICCNCKNSMYGILTATKQVVENHLKSEDPQGNAVDELLKRTHVQLKIDEIPAGVGAACPAIVDRLSRRHHESALVVRGHSFFDMAMLPIMLPIWTAGMRGSWGTCASITRIIAWSMRC